jgi:iron complex outermembrane receptor protein
VRIVKLSTGVSASVLALVAMAPAFAQSTGTQEFDRQQIVVTGKKAADSVAGVTVPATPKARNTFTQEFIERQRPGQTIDDILNYMPGVSFQNNGPYGDAGGTLTIHGFDGTRISQTFDGIPMNDSGNYALYPQDQIDHELIERVDVSLGSTDIDSPTASATGSTINYITRNPTEDFHVRLEGSAGQWDFMRIFGVVDTGDFTKYGTRAFISASHQNDVDPYNPGAKLSKSQINAKVYQPIGSNGDFISVAGWYSNDRGNRFGDVLLKNTNSITGVGAPSGFPSVADLRDYVIPGCRTTIPTNGKDTANSCGTVYDYGYQPSNNANIRVNSRFTLADGLILTVDPSYNYTKANGSSAVAATEGFYSLKNGSKTTPIYGFIGGKPYFGGVPLNGDGDTLDTVEVNAPSNTITQRYVVIANLIYKITPTQTIRLNYSFDHARLRQTGEVGLLNPDGHPADYFPSDDPLLDASGKPIEKRNRTAYSILNQVSGEYRGEFFDSKLVVQAGLRVPFFKRDLHNYCVSESGGNGYVDCFNDPTSQAAFLAANPTYQAPQSRHYNYNHVLPSAGLTYNFTPSTSIFFDYSQGIQVPSTDDLYDAFAFSPSVAAAHPKPETTYNFEGGVRYKTNKIQAQLSGWYTAYHNRIVSSAVPDPQNPDDFITLFTNLGTVHKYGVDGSIAYAPMRQLTLYAFGSYLHSKILDNVLTGACTANNVKFGDSAGTGPCTTVGQSMYALTAGKRESGSPTFTFGGRAQANLGPVEIGLQAKRTGPRYVNDQNTPFYSGSTVIFPAKAPAYTLVDLDARLSLGFLGLNDKTYLQLNVTNIFDKFYVGGFSGGVSNSFVPYAYIGTPRTISGTVNFAF